jgi:iron complex outermembrane receptor protein
LLACRALAHALFWSPNSARAEEVLEVDVRGELLPRAGDESLPSAVVAGDALEAPGAGLVDLLRSLPSVAIARTGGNFDLATISLRGGTSAQTPIFFGPIRLNDELTGTADLSLVPPLLLRRIEVYRGHSPIHLGASGLTGAIVLQPAVATSPEAQLTLSLGSFGERAITASSGVGDGRSGASLAVRAASTDGDFDYVDDGGTRFDESDDAIRTRRNADARSLDVWSTSTLRTRDLDVDVFVRSFTREQGVPGLGVLPAERARSAVRGAMVGAMARARVGRATVLGATSARWSTTEIDDPLGELLLSNGGARLEANGVTSRLELALEEDALDFAAGLSLASEGIDVGAGPPLGVTGREARARLHARGAARPSPLFEGVIEAAVSSTSLLGAEGLTGAAGAPELRLGATLRPDPALHVFATAGLYRRLPMLGERLGIGATVLGNPGLLPERGLSADLGARLALDLDELALAAELTGFARSAQDLVAYQRSSFGAIKPFNLGEARILGVDVMASATALGWIVLGGSLNVTDARDVSDGRGLVEDRVAFVAPLTLSPFAGLEHHLGGIVDHLSARVRLDYRSARNADPAGLVELPQLLDLGLEGAVGLSRELLELRARLSNLTQNRTTDLIGYPLPGLNGHVFLAARWR